eukprot:jgi/Mesvir1/21637/Mv04059-RA.1
MRYWGLITPSDREWDPKKMIETFVLKPTDVAPSLPVSDATPAPPVAAPPASPDNGNAAPNNNVEDAVNAPLEPITDAPAESSAPALASSDSSNAGSAANPVVIEDGEEVAADGLVVKTRRGKTDENPIDVEAGSDGYDTPQSEDLVPNLKTRTSWYAEVYYPRRMGKRVDVDFEYESEYVDTVLGGDRIAFKRGSKGDGNCFWYSFFLGKAFKNGDTVTQKQLERMTKELRAQIDEKLDDYVFGNHRIVHFGPSEESTREEFRDNMRGQLKDKEYASDTLASVVAYHTKTDIYLLAGQRVDGKTDYLMTAYKLSGRPRAQESERSEEPPVYIFHNGEEHYEALIPQSWLPTQPVASTSETSGVSQSDDLSALRDTRASPIEKSVERLEEHLSGAGGSVTSGVTSLEAGAVRVLEDGATGAMEDGARALEAMLQQPQGDYLTPLQMADSKFRKIVEDEIMKYNGPDDPILSNPRRPPEVIIPPQPVAADDKQEDGKKTRKRSTRGRKRSDFYPDMAMKDAQDAIEQFQQLNDLPVQFRWAPLSALPVDVRYKKIPGGLKIQVKFHRNKEFMDWLLIAKSRMLKTLGIDALGLYADQMLPTGKMLGLYTGRVLGEYELNDKTNRIENTLTSLRSSVLTVIGDDDKLLTHSYLDGVERLDPPILVDGGHGAATSGIEAGQTFDPLDVGVIYPWTYLHMSNDPRGAVDPRTGAKHLPNTAYADGSPGLRVLNPIYPREEIVWLYDNDKIGDDGSFETVGDEHNGYGKRLWMFQQVMKKKMTQKELDDALKEEKNASLEIVIDNLKEILEGNKRISAPPLCTGRPKRSCAVKPDKVPILLDDVDLENLQRAAQASDLDAKKLDELGRLLEEYVEWMHSDAF